MAASIQRNESPNSTPVKEAPNVAVIRNYTEAERRFMERQRKMVWSFLYFYYRVNVCTGHQLYFSLLNQFFISSFHYTQEVSQWIVYFQEADRILKKASKTHKEKVEDFNRHLDSLTEHFDIPKVSWTKWSIFCNVLCKAVCCRLRYLYNITHSGYQCVFSCIK